MLDRIIGNGHLKSNEQNQHFAELIYTHICLYTHAVVIQRGLPSLERKLERFVTEKWKKRSAKLE